MRYRPRSHPRPTLRLSQKGTRYSEAYAFTDLMSGADMLSLRWCRSSSYSLS
jgi:hypothetical protein